MIAIALPLLLAGGAAGAFYLQLHRVSATLRLTGLPVLAPPTHARRILILSPHCDDETLAVGGMIADARRSGAEVTVVFLTNGDGFWLAAGRELNEVRLSPADYIRFAERRQKESVAALAELGVPEDHVVFLGYPDRGLASLWKENWDPANPFRSTFTQKTQSPYRRSFTKNALYCGDSVLSDIRRLMDRVRPTDIYVTHPADDHPDHSTAAAFAQAALLQERDRGAGWSQAASLRYFLVHRGDWPLPQGRHADLPLLPPAALAAFGTCDTAWEVYPLSPEAIAAKSRALAQYRSQMAVSDRFLSSFVRENELFGTIPSLVVASGQRGAKPAVAHDPMRDDIVRYAGPSADLAGVTLTPVGNHAVRVRVALRGRVSPRVRYRLLLRCEGEDGRTHFWEQDLESDAGSSPERRDRKSIETLLPLRQIDPGGTPNRIWAAAETYYWSRLPVDRMGFRPFDLVKESGRSSSPSP